MIPYSEQRALFEAAKAMVTPSEAHGILCGMACVGVHSVDTWLTEVLDPDASGATPLWENTYRLREIMQAALANLENEDLAFSLLLPDDDEMMAVRSEELGRWCGGFLLGFGLGGAQPGLGEDEREFLRDVAQIAQIDPDATGTEDEEVGYVSLVEYLRVGVNLLKPPSDDEGDSAGPSR